MDMVSSCREKLSYFRIKELKDVLTQLGLAKQGKKQDLVDRILGFLSDDQVLKLHGWGKRNTIGKDGVAKIIEDTYRKMQVPGSVDSTSKSHSGSDLNYVKPKEEYDDSKLDMKIRCLCGSSLVTDSMIQCEDSRCQVWQHIGCVIISEKPFEGLQPEIPKHFYCEICRVNRADPFWYTVANPLLPVKTSPVPASDGASVQPNVERTFQLGRSDRDLLQKTEYDLQVWCILLNDKVPFRMQWPLQCELVVNGVAIRTTNRPGNQLLGINARDNGPLITTCSREGTNKINFTRSDARTFCFGLRIVKRRTIQQVLSLIPKDTESERFEDALARVCRCIGGGADAEDADSDSDLEVVAESVTINLRCPMSGSRMKIASRFKPCVHMGCFDLETFVKANELSRKWQCPICLKNYSLENIIIDPYFNRITSLLQDFGEDINEIDVKPDGSWRVKTEGEILAPWHLPDGTLQPITNAEIKSNSELWKQSKQENTGLKLGNKRRNGIWEVNNKHNQMTLPSSGNHALEKFDAQCQKVLPLSVSATGSYRDGDDVSVNQEGRGHFDFAASNGQELDSMNFEMMYEVDGRMPPAPPRDADLIVLSDSEEDNITLISPETAYDHVPSNGPFTATHPGVQDSYLVDPELNMGGQSCLGLFGNSEDFDPLWQTCSQTGAGFQLFNNDADVSGSLVGVHHNPLGCPPMDGYGLASGGVDTAQHQDVTTCHPIDQHRHLESLTCPLKISPLACQSNAEGNNSLVENPLGFPGDDASLQIFLPTQPVSVTAQSDLNQQVDLSNGRHTDDWISLRLGGNDSSHIESAPANSLNSGQFFSSKDRLNSLANTALLQGNNDDRSDRGPSNNQRSDYPHSQQQRSVRPRLYLSIDSD